MKNIKTFETFFDNDIEHYRYLDLEHLENGDLKIILNSEGLIEAKEANEDGKFNESEFYNFFEDIESNSEYMYFQDMSVVGIGMSEAPCVTNGYYYDDNGVTDDDYSDDSEIYYYQDSYIKDFTEELLENGFVVFRTNKPNTPEQIEDIKLNKVTKKYNL